MSTPLRCAILSAAHVHTNAYAAALLQLPDALLAGVWDDDPARGQTFADRYGVPYLAHLDRSETWDAFDAAIITSENARHHGLCLAACAAGKHVLCEKPLAITREEAEAMIAAARAAQVVLGTAFPMRHNAAARRMRAAVQEGAIGSVLAVRATNHGTLPPGWFQDATMAGGGAVMDHTVHVADLLRWYLQDEPVEVYAEISNGFYGLGVDDAALLTISFRTGVVATLDPSWSRPPSFPIWGDLTMEIAGTHGTISLDAFNQHLLYYPRQSMHPTAFAWGPDADTAMIADFVAAARAGRDPAASGRDGERALAVALAAYASARSGQPVRIAP
ncbi:MAG TPA: Gfo/Idh/MocA family oxidoreductase [Chloroflexota bacterium]|nr:Gfo/Idh/MocA family oxidoreductase [Chloroflexota bacterium]